MGEPRDTSQLGGLVPIGEAARQLGVSVDTVRRWQDGGKLQGYRTPGGQRRIYQADIDRVLAGSRGTTEEAVS